MKSKAKPVIKQSKRDSWENYVNTSTNDTPPSKMWTKLDKCLVTKHTRKFYLQ